MPARHVAPFDEFLRRTETFIAGLSSPQYAIYTALWSLMARASAPVVVRNIGFDQQHVQSVIDQLRAQHLIWYDDDLRAVLQCPPFSALHTPHQVKAFGWDRAYTCSFIDALMTVLLYGPNTWIKIDSTCPRSEERIAFRALMTSDYRIRLDTPREAEGWSVWMPSPGQDGLGVGVRGTRPQINAFFTYTDLETFLNYQPDQRGARSTLPQVVYLAEQLLIAYMPLLRLP